MQFSFQISDEDSGVVEWAMHTLSQIASWLEGAQAIVDAMVLDYVLVLLKSSRSEVRERTCTLLGWLSTHEFTAAAVLELKPCKQLVSLLG